MKTLMLSDEEYNILKNSKTPEELWTIKDSLMNSDALLKYHDKKYVAIQCLSLEQYNNYIINGTLDGAIIKNENSVWHTIKVPGKIYASINYGYADGFSSDNMISNLGTQIAPSYRNASLVERFMIRSSNPSPTKTINVYSEASANTKTNTSYVLAGENDQSYIAAFYFDPNCRILRFSVLSVKPQSTYSNKNVISTNQSASVSVPQASSLTMTIRFVHTCSFRPVFKFIDNNKSKTIYY